MNETRRSEIIAAAKKLLVDCGLDGTYPIPAESIPSLISYKLVFFDPKENEDFLDISGAIHYEEKEILINKKDHPKRQLFTIAHELGHAILHSKNHDDAGKIDYRANLYESFNPTEAEANLFAAELLMPEHQFRKQWEIEQGDIYLISLFFFVSEKAVEIRAKSLKLR